MNGNSVLTPYANAYQSQFGQSTTDATAPVRKPGNFLTHLLPIAGATLATLAAPETGGLSLAGLAAAGGLGAFGAGAGKVVENKAENTMNPNLKQSLLSGVSGAAAQGGIAGGVGEALAPVIGGAGSFLKSLVGKGGTEAATTGATDLATQGATQGTSDVTSAAANMGKGDVLRAGVRNLDPVVRDTPGLAANAADNVARINQFADVTAPQEYGVNLTGSAAKQGRQIPLLKSAINDKLSQAFAADTTQPFTTQEVKDSLAKAVGSHPLFPSSLTGRTPAGEALNNSLLNANNIVDNMAANNEGKFSLQDLNTLRQQIDKGINFNASPDAAAAINNEAGNAMRQTLNETIKSNPEVAKLIEHQQNAIVLDKGLAASAGRATGGGGAMVRPTGIGVRLPGAAGIMQSGTDALGRSLQEISANPVGSVATRLAPQAAGAEISNINQQEQAQQGAQSVGNVDLTSPGSDISSQLQGYVPSDTPVINGLPSSDTIKQLELKDLETTGGKNYTMLSRLGTISAAQEKQSVLPSSAEKGLTTYQQQLGILQNIAQAFQGNGDFNAVANTMSQSIPDLSKATGLSAKQITAMLPNASDRADVAVQKLQQIKTLMDAKASDTLSSTISTQNNSPSSSILDSLLGSAGATP